MFDLFLKDECILKWKGALRTKHYYDSMDSSKWKVLFDIVKAPSNEAKETVKKIKAFSKKCMSYNGKSGGISYPVASTIVYFFSKGECPIIDWRAVKTLTDYGFKVQDDDWDKYFDICSEIVNNYKISFRELDKALWIYQDIKKQLPICKKLNDLERVNHISLDEPLFI